MTIVRLVRDNLVATLEYSTLTPNGFSTRSAAARPNSLAGWLVSPAGAAARRAISGVTDYNLACDIARRNSQGALLDTYTERNLDEFFAQCAEELRLRVSPLLVLERFYSCVYHQTCVRNGPPAACAKAQKELLKLAQRALPPDVHIDILNAQPRFEGEVIE